MPKLKLAAAFLVACLSVRLLSQDLSPPGPSAGDLAPPPVSADLGLTPARSAEFEQALKLHDYKSAETILIDETQQDSKSPRSAKLFIAAGHLFFLDGQYLNSAIAWKKAEAITPLSSRDRFSLAMAYIRLGRRDWARHELGGLSAAEPRNVLYLYWLGRLDYDQRRYDSAISKFNTVVSIDPTMMRAYDNLGLCYEMLGRSAEAIRNYVQAVELNRKQPNPSPWPPLNFAVTLLSANRLSEAEAELREAAQYDPKFAQAQYQLGKVFEQQNKPEAAIESFEQAIKLDPNYTEAHYRLGMRYQKLGRREDAQKEMAIVRELKKQNLQEAQKEMENPNGPKKNLNSNNAPNQ